MNEAWELARISIKKTQRNQKNYYDKRSKPPKFKVGERVLVYMPSAKACKAYKFARPFHGPYRIRSLDGTGVVIQPVNKPQAEPIRVAYDRIRHCSELIADKFWPTSATNCRGKHSKKISSTPANSDDNHIINGDLVNHPHPQQQGASSAVVLCKEANPWKNCLRPRQANGEV